MEAELKLQCDELDDASLQGLTINLCNAINDAGDSDGDGQVTASWQQTTAETGVRGDPITIGTILLTLIGSGGVAVSLIQVFKSYVERNRNLKITIKTKDGTSIEVDSSNLSGEQLDKAAKMLTKALGA